MKYPGLFLPISPRPYANELISSWIARTGAVYGLASKEMMKHISWSGLDIDYNPKESDLKRLSGFTRYPVELIQELTLKKRYPYRKKADFFSVRPDSMHLPVYCSACFEQDLKAGRQPYWRSQWANIWSATCSHHRFYLSESCESMSCYLRGNSKSEYFKRCLFCKRQCSKRIYCDKSSKTYATNEDQENQTDTPRVGDYVDQILIDFQMAIADALDGIRPGRQWWCGGNPKAFRMISNDLISIITQQQKPFSSSYTCPARFLLSYNGINLFVHEYEFNSTRERRPLGNITEACRIISLKTLARIMMDPNEFCHFKFKLIFDKTYSLFHEYDDLLHIFMGMLSEENKSNILRLYVKWPLEARARVDDYINKL